MGVDLDYISTHRGTQNYMKSKHTHKINLKRKARHPIAAQSASGTPHIEQPTHYSF